MECPSRGDAKILLRSLHASVVARVKDIHAERGVVAA
jgi:hypothetical protein